MTKVKLRLYKVIPRVPEGREETCWKISQANLRFRSKSHQKGMNLPQTSRPKSKNCFCEVCQSKPLENRVVSWRVPIWRGTCRSLRPAVRFYFFGIKRDKRGKELNFNAHNKGKENWRENPGRERESRFSRDYCGNGMRVQNFRA